MTTDKAAVTPERFTVTVSISDENGGHYATQELQVSGNRTEVERLMYYANRHPVNHFRVYTLSTGGGLE